MLLIHFHAVMFIGRITRRWTRPRRRAFFWLWDSGWFVSRLMVLFTIISIDHSLRWWLQCDPDQWIPYLLFYMLQFMLVFGSILKTMADDIFCTVIFLYCVEQLSLWLVIFGRTIMTFWDFLDWDWTLVLFCGFYISGPIQVYYRIHSAVYLQNVILLLERWNKIMLFFPRKKKIQMCLLL